MAPSPRTYGGRRIKTTPLAFPNLPSARASPVPESPIRKTSITRTQPTRQARNAPAKKSMGSSPPSSSETEAEIEVEVPDKRQRITRAQGARKTTPVPMNIDRSPNAPTISPLSRLPSPAKSLRDIYSVSPSPPRGQKVAEDDHMDIDEQEQQHEGVTTAAPDDSRSPNGSSSPTSSESSSSSDDPPENKGYAKPDYSKPIVFTPYFKRPEFIPQPKITGNEAWAADRVWNAESKRYEVAKEWDMSKGGTRVWNPQTLKYEVDDDEKMGGRGRNAKKRKYAPNETFGGKTFKYVQPTMPSDDDEDNDWR